MLTAANRTSSARVEQPCSNSIALTAPPTPARVAGFWPRRAVEPAVQHGAAAAASAWSRSELEESGTAPEVGSSSTARKGGLFVLRSPVDSWAISWAIGRFFIAYW